MEAALEHKRKDLVDLLMGLGVVDNNPAALQAAVKDGNEDLVVKLLDLGGNIHHVDLENGSLLQIAAANGHEKIASLLFEKGFNPNEPGCAIAPALTAVIRAKHNAIAKLLLQKKPKEMSRLVKALFIVSGALIRCATLRKWARISSSVRILVLGPLDTCTCTCSHEEWRVNMNAV